jgi:hypothetical protein
MSENIAGKGLTWTRAVIPLQLVVAFLTAWLQGEQQEVIKYLREENRILRAQLQGRRLRLPDDERRRLAVLGARLGRRILMHVATIVTAETILRWHRPAHCPQVDVPAAATRAARRAPGDPPACGADGDRQPKLGIYPHSGGLEESRSFLLLSRRIAATGSRCRAELSDITGLEEPITFQRRRGARRRLGGGGGSCAGCNHPPHVVNHFYFLLRGGNPAHTGLHPGPRGSRHLGDSITCSELPGRYFSGGTVLGSTWPLPAALA